MVKGIMVKGGTITKETTIIQEGKENPVEIHQHVDFKTAISVTQVTTITLNTGVFKVKLVQGETVGSPTPRIKTTNMRRISLQKLITQTMSIIQSIKGTIKGKSNQLNKSFPTLKFQEF